MIDRTKCVLLHALAQYHSSAPFPGTSEPVEVVIRARVLVLVAFAPVIPDMTIVQLAVLCVSDLQSDAPGRATALMVSPSRTAAAVFRVARPLCLQAWRSDQQRLLLFVEPGGRPGCSAATGIAYSEDCTGTSTLKITSSECLQ